MSFIPDTTKTNWERGKDALEVIMKYVSIEKLESLATKAEDPKLRNSFAVKAFIKSL